MKTTNQPTKANEIVTDALWIPRAGHCSKSVLQVNGNGKAGAVQVDITPDEYRELIRTKSVIFSDGAYVKFDYDVEAFEDLQTTQDDASYRGQ